MKKLVLFISLLLVVMQGMAQIPFGISFPSPQNFVMVTTNGVNLRKAPNTSSPRLVFRSGTSEDCLDCEDELVWSSGPMKRGDKPVNPKLLYIRGESGDWWNVNFYQDLYGDSGYSEMAYIMKRFCKRLTPKNLPLTAPRDKNIVVIKSGKYQSLCIEWFYGIYDRQFLRIGRYIDGVYAFVYSIKFSDNNTNETYFNLQEGSYMLYLGGHLFNSSGTLDLNKLAADSTTLNYIVSNYNKMRHDNVTYLGFEGYTEWFKWGY